VGARDPDTPTGRTFLLGSIVDTGQSYSPLILPLGSHSDTLDSYGGGPGTVVLHGWPDASVFGNAISHGCVRVPADALGQLRQVPLGTLVIVDQQWTPEEKMRTPTQDRCHRHRPGDSGPADRDRLDRPWRAHVQLLGLRRLGQGDDQPDRCGDG